MGEVTAWHPPRNDPGVFDTPHTPESMQPKPRSDDHNSVATSSAPPRSTYTASLSQATDGKRKISLRSPKYRDEISEHGVYLDYFGTTMPAAVEAFAQEVVMKDSPHLPTRIELLGLREKIISVCESDELTFRDTIVRLLPEVDHYEQPRRNSTLATGSDILWNTIGLPFVYTPTKYAPIVAPKPDRHYGYSLHAFKQRQDRDSVALLRALSDARIAA